MNQQEIIRSSTEAIFDEKNNSVETGELSLDSLYCKYLQNVLLIQAYEDHRKSQKKSIVDQLNFIQHKVDEERACLLSIDKRINEIYALTRQEEAVKRLIQLYKQLTNIANLFDIDSMISKLKQDTRGLPLCNFNLPQTENEAKHLENTMVQIADEMKQIQNREKSSISASELINCLQEMTRINEMQAAVRNSCEEKLNLLDDLTRTRTSYAICSNDSHELDVNISELI